MATTLYGIPNCDSVKRARAWLADHGVAHGFIDFKKAGVPADRLDDWLARAGWQTLVNRKGTTWRGLPEDARAAVVDTGTARALLLAWPSVIKRPVVAWDSGALTVGFEPDAFAAAVRGPAPG